MKLVHTLGSIALLASVFLATWLYSQNYMFGDATLEAIQNDGYYSSDMEVSLNDVYGDKFLVLFFESNFTKHLDRIKTLPNYQNYNVKSEVLDFEEELMEGEFNFKYGAVRYLESDKNMPLCIIFIDMNERSDYYLSTAMHEVGHCIDYREKISTASSLSFNESEYLKYMLKFRVELAVAQRTIQDAIELHDRILREIFAEAIGLREIEIWYGKSTFLENVKRSRSLYLKHESSGGLPLHPLTIITEIAEELILNGFKSTRSNQVFYEEVIEKVKSSPIPNLESLVANYYLMSGELGYNVSLESIRQNDQEMDEYFQYLDKLTLFKL